MSSLEAVVLAAGQGKRMRSALPKILHAAAGRPLVHYPVQAALSVGAARVVVVVSPETLDPVQSYLVQAFGAERSVTCVQDPPRGTGDAARVGLEHVSAERVLVLYGDTPLLAPRDLLALVAVLDERPEALLALMTCELDDPTGYGRVLRDAGGQVREVREHRDLANDAERAVREINAGVYASRTGFLKKAVGELSSNNAQGELYLTDVVASAAARGGAAAVRGDREVLLGVNDRFQLAQAEDILFRRIAERHGKEGVSVRGDARIDDSVVIEADAIIEAGVRLRGQTVVHAGAVIDVGSVVTDSEIGAHALLKPYSVVTESTVGHAAQIGPFAHLRPGSQIDEEAHIGNFVETKKTRVRRGAKANHLAYLGDGDVGERANVGAGTIFCNYDGFKKHQTLIGEDAFIGSDSQLVAPVTIGRDAYVATGTTVTKDVPDGALAIGRTRQQNKEGYASRLKARLAAQKKR